jgi:hypothetical protein
MLTRILSSLALVAVASSTVFGGAVHSHDALGSNRHHRLTDLQVYEALLVNRDSNPAHFDYAHPFFGRLIRDDQFFAWEFNRWFSHETPFGQFSSVGRVLEGREEWRLPHILRLKPSNPLPVVPPPHTPRGPLGSNAGARTNDSQAAQGQPATVAQGLRAAVLTLRAARTSVEARIQREEDRTAEAIPEVAIPARLLARRFPNRRPSYSLVSDRLG